ncbi:Tol-Pal system beta propeller repeat protein TolB [Desulfomonile tiedjei]|uniref:Tol-pal system beta propeller repeat protein TolB n=1 Tax=Desulfomonile tiedjei (strain ATCC 49306 / DSM 6799 / DCB-1) TaxID=706587 RepID=I4BZU2_DESTA|nr:Tol-Pal system beta propeller repeat protein TolB [Desulfomonile tiedjei]AFM22833.1 tol-pal system beta propeller repeat protein TolB [Desulfomonile tiedjei DSM 6799]
MFLQLKKHFFFTVVMALLTLMYCVPGYSEPLIIDVDPTLTLVAVPDLVSAEPSPIGGKALADVIKDDLYFTGLFKTPDVTLNIPPTASGEPDFEKWMEARVGALILGNFSTKGEELTVEVRLYNIALKKLEVGKRYTGNIKDYRRIMHRFADRVMEKLTGVPGCFSTKIAFVGDSQSRELFVMDFDGHNLTPLTRTNSINLSPDWSPDGRSIIFTSYIRGNPDVWAVDFPGLGLRPLSSRPGLNASPRHSPDGNYVALSANVNNLPKIIVINAQGNMLKVLTNGRGNDISPAWSPDGAAMAYVSDQAGTPQIYVMSSQGGQPKRLTFNSNYNTDPDWSPRGDLIAFTARVEGRFQICTMKPDGTDLRVLTSAGSNQDPAWSPDGRFIAFVSNRDGRRLIYIMDSRGRIQAPVSPITGKSPAWSRNSW